MSRMAGRRRERALFIKSTTRVRQSCTKKSYVIRGEESRVPIKADTPGSTMIHHDDTNQIARIIG